LSNQEIGKLLSVMLDEKDGIEEGAALEEDFVLAAEEDDDDDDVSGFNGVAGTSIPATGLPMIYKKKLDRTLCNIVNYQ